MGTPSMTNKVSLQISLEINFLYIFIYVNFKNLTVGLNVLSISFILAKFQVFGI